MKSHSRRNLFAKTVIYLLLFVLSGLFIMPFLWLVSTSVKPDRQVMLFPPKWIPTQPIKAKVDGKLQPIYQLQSKEWKARVAILDSDERQVALRVLESSNKRLPEVLVMRKQYLNAGGSLSLVPEERVHFFWSNYKAGLSFIPFLSYLWNTLRICFWTVLGTLISCSLVAYGLSRIQWRGRDTLFVILLATMMLPFQVTMVPMFTVFKTLGWLDKILPLTAPAFLGNAFFIFLLRQFFMTIPGDLTDAARLDGCSEFDIYRRIVLPLSRPALATVGLFAFMGAWNDYAGPLIYLFDESHYTLSLGLAMFSSQYGSYWNWLMAVSTVVTVPIIFLFFLTQKTFIQGITFTGMKS